MKHILTGLAALTLVACGGNTSNGNNAATSKPTAADVATAAANKIGSAVCPASEIINDVAAYKNDHPAAQEDYAAWHAENGKRDGVVTTESGLQYQVAQTGPSNGPSPVGSQLIKVNYHGFFPNGDVFDSSYERGQPIDFPANAVIQGWIEGLGKMKPCDAWTIYVPGNLAYGPRGRPGIPGNATLGFHVQLLEVK